MRILYARSNRIVRLFRSCSSDLFLELDRSFCGSFYWSHLWTSYKKSSFSKIRVAYNNFYRKLLHVSGRSSASAMFVENNIPNFECLIRMIPTLPYTFDTFSYIYSAARPSCSVHRCMPSPPSRLLLYPG